MISTADHGRIAEAVSKAEAHTSGEILCVLSHKVSDYREIPLAWGFAAAMVLPALASTLGLHPWLTSEAGGDWVATNAAALDVSVGAALTAYALAQLAIFTVVSVAVAAITPLKLALTPRVLKRKRVKRAAMHHLAAAHLLGAGGAVVIFASEAERMVTVAAWDAAVAAVLAGVKAKDPTAGFVQAVEICGGFLAEHFPAEGARHSAVSDRLLEI